MNASKEDLEWIEKFYKDVKYDFDRIGKIYDIPKDYIKRALNILYGKRNIVGYHYEGIEASKSSGD